MVHPKTATESVANLVNDRPVTDVTEEEFAKHTQAWVAVLELSSVRLGPGLASEILLPPVLTAVEG